jgi:hypothetical protein
MYFNSISLYSGHEFSNEKEIAFCLVRVRFVTQFLFFGIPPAVQRVQDGPIGGARVSFIFYFVVKKQPNKTTLIIKKDKSNLVSFCLFCSAVSSQRLVQLKTKGNKLKRKKQRKTKRGFELANRQKVRLLTANHADSLFFLCTLTRPGE